MVKAIVFGTMTQHVKTQSASRYESENSLIPNYVTAWNLGPGDSQGQMV